MNTQLNGTPVEINFGEKSLEELVETHNEMCLAASDFGLTAEPVASFENVQVAVAACERLHGQILKARERAAAPPKKQRRKSEAKAKKAATAAPDDSGKVVAGFTEPKKEKKVVAKKAKKTKSAKKAKVASNGARKSGPRLPGDTRITWLAEGNPARKGSIFYDRVEKVRRAKTIDAVLKAGGTGADAKECAKRKWAKLERGASA